MNQSDLVSILIPLYNKEKYIVDTLTSIDRQITYGKFSIEVIIVDDKSTDNSLELVKDFEWKNPNITRVDIISNQENVGPAVTFNTALDLSKGNFIIPFDADDLMTRKGAYFRYLELISDASADWVSGDVLVMNDEGYFRSGKENVLNENEYRNYTRDEVIEGVLASKFPISAQSVMIRREAAVRTRWINTIRSSQDTGMWLSLAANGYVLKKIEHYVAIYRSRAGHPEQGGLFGESIISGQKVRDFENMKVQLQDFLNDYQLSLLDAIILHFRNHRYLEKVKSI